MMTREVFIVTTSIQTSPISGKPRRVWFLCRRVGNGDTSWDTVVLHAYRSKRKALRAMDKANKLEKGVN